MVALYVGCIVFSLSCVIVPKDVVKLFMYL